MPYLRANTDAAFGFAPYDGVKRISQYSKLSSTAAIFAGDVVLLNSSGQVQSAATITDRAIVGVAAESIASGSTTTCMVYDDPDQLFVAQDDSVGTALAQTHIGNQFSITGFTPGTAAQVTRNRSIMQVDTSTAAAGTEGTLNQAVMVVGLHPIESGFPSAASNPRKVIVRFNPAYHIFATSSGV